MLPLPPWTRLWGWQSVLGRITCYTRLGGTCLTTRKRAEGRFWVSWQRGSKWWIKGKGGAAEKRAAPPPDLLFCARFCPVIGKEGRRLARFLDLAGEGGEGGVTASPLELQEGNPKPPAAASSECKAHFPSSGTPPSHTSSPGPYLLWGRRDAG